MNMLAHIPLSLYIHIPWCVRKCPYCDFNSHALKNELPEEAYVAALIQDLDENLHYIQDRPLASIFFGGGTPSLFSASAIAAILEAVQKRIQCPPEMEITLEANPGTFEQQRFKDYRFIGINRLSIGVQSLQDKHLQTLGRIHDKTTAVRAVKTAQDAGFENMNVDIMFGLPQQSLAEGLQDLQEALNFNTPHLSWYQLTLEPNTAFYHQRPPLPPDDQIWAMQIEGQALLAAHRFKQYEVSAYSQKEQHCHHNLNYWRYGDYLGIGAGAHSKITLKPADTTQSQEAKTIIRHWQVKNPRDYLNSKLNKTAQQIQVSPQEMPFEFMLNGLRLCDGISLSLFEERTGLGIKTITEALTQAQNKKLLEISDHYLKPTELGKRFLNDLVEMFL
jgi:putative oxygen-independent coproporphyrinogen III oxidase